MSLIIEDKDRLNSLADTIINANGSNATQPATVEELKEQINNFIPLKSKFASGVFTPSEDITSANAPWLDFALGTDNNGNRIIPNLIFAFQPYVLQNAEVMNASCYIILIYGVPLINPFNYSNYTVWGYNTFKRATPSSSSSIYYTGGLQNGTIVGEQESEEFIFTKNKFRLRPIRDTYPLLAGHPIVWLQIKF